MLTGCYSPIEDYGCGFVIKFANSSKVLIDESYIEIFHVDMMPIRSHHYTICLNDAGLKRSGSFVKYKKVSVIFEGKKICDGTFVSPESPMWYNDCISFVFFGTDGFVQHRFLLELNNSDLFDSECEEKLITYFSNIGKLLITE